MNNRSDAEIMGQPERAERRLQRAGAFVLYAVAAAVVLGVAVLREALTGQIHATITTPAGVTVTVDRNPRTVTHDYGEPDETINAMRSVAERR